MVTLIGTGLVASAAILGVYAVLRSLIATPASPTDTDWEDEWDL